MKSTWQAAADFAARYSQNLSTKPRSELLALQPVSEISHPDIPVGFIATVEYGPMLNGTLSVAVVVGKFVLFGFRWKSVVRAFEVTYEGQLQVFPEEWMNQSSKERRRSLTWHC